MSSGIDVPMNDRAKELNCPKQFYQGQASRGGHLAVYLTRRAAEGDPGPYSGFDARAKKLKAYREQYAQQAAAEPGDTTQAVSRGRVFNAGPAAKQ